MPAETIPIPAIPPELCVGLRNQGQWIELWMKNLDPESQRERISHTGYIVLGVLGGLLALVFAAAVLMVPIVMSTASESTRSLAPAAFAGIFNLVALVAGGISFGYLVWSPRMECEEICDSKAERVLRPKRMAITTDAMLWNPSGTANVDGPFYRHFDFEKLAITLSGMEIVSPSGRTETTLSFTQNAVAWINACLTYLKTCIPEENSAASGTLPVKVQVAVLDRQWERTRNRYLVTSSQTVSSEPSLAVSLAVAGVGIVPFLFLFSWQGEMPSDSILFACASLPFALPVSIGIAIRACRYQPLKKRYLADRSRLEQIRIEK